MLTNTRWLGKHLILVNRFFPSSKLCSNCGQKTNHLRLKDRLWVCSFCGIKHDRDKNDSINLKVEGIRILKEERNIMVIHEDNTTVGTTESHAFGEDVRPIKILKSCLGSVL